jgi:hypothetical protein
MNVASLMAVAIDPSRIFVARGQMPDPWQRDVLRSRDRQLLLNCSRQAGKSSVVAALALHTALFTPGGALVLIVTPTLRQSQELLRKVREDHLALGSPGNVVRGSLDRLEMGNGSRVLGLPGREGTIRSFGGVRLLVLDEAARIPDSLYRSVRPMLAVSRGRLVALSTPWGCRGWFYREWYGPARWRRFHIPWRQCPRITPEFIAEERLALGDDWVRQEYEGDFLAMAGRVYADFELALVPEGVIVPSGRQVGGIDFGWRNPFAAVWGVVDRDDVLWIVGERYQTQTPLYEHAAALARLGDVLWYCDPAGRTEREELIAAGLTVRAGTNSIRAGVGAVTARIRTGRLRVVAVACPNLIEEARLYRYQGEDEGRAEDPQDRHNHALDALRYLVSRLDARSGARDRPVVSEEDVIAPGDLWNPVG